jgi:hypothetical protein
MSSALCRGKPEDATEREPIGKTSRWRRSPAGRPLADDEAILDAA